MRYVLDTNAVSALMRGETGMLDRLSHVARHDVAIPQPVLAELQYGVERLPAGRRRERLRERLAHLRAEIVRCSWDDEVSERFGVTKKELERRGARLEDFDVAIAAHAQASGAVLVTHDRALQTRISGLQFEDWAHTQRA